MPNGFGVSVFFNPGNHDAALSGGSSGLSGLAVQGFRVLALFWWRRVCKSKPGLVEMLHSLASPKARSRNPKLLYPKPLKPKPETRKP